MTLTPETIRAVLFAIRTPTQAMLEAGCSAHPEEGYHQATLLNDIIECEWKAMIDKALQEHGT